MAYKLIKETKRVYLKNFSNPYNMTSNGTLGGNSFAVDGTSPSTGTLYQVHTSEVDWTKIYGCTNVDNGYIIWYNPTPFKLMTLNTFDDGNNFINNCKIYGSNDNSTWTFIRNGGTPANNPIAVNSKEFYKYYKLTFNTANTRAFYFYWINLVGYTEGSENDYDTYEDVDIYKIIGTQSQQAVYNVDIVGNLTNNEGILSGFSSSNYASLPTTFNPNSNPWELVLKFNLSSIGIETNLFCGRNSGLSYGLNLFINSTGKIYCYIGNGSSWIFVLNGTSTLVTSKDYWIKVKFSGTVYSIYLSDTGVFSGEEITEISYNSSTSMINQVSILGFNAGQSEGELTGSIDLNSCYIKINGVKTWEGATAIPIYELIEETQSA